MSPVSAQLNYLHLAPRKVRLVAGVLRGLPVYEAEAQLMMMRKRAAPPLLQLLRSAMANAKNKQVKLDTLVVKTVQVNQGPMVKRFLPRAKGIATPIHKIMSHITLTLAEGGTAFKPRFVIIPPEKKEAKKKRKAPRAASPAPKEKLSAQKAVKAAEEPGFIRRIFRRKVIT